MAKDDEILYTKSHEWIEENIDNTVTVGISDHAQELLGDMVFLELPEIGTKIEKGDEIAVAESVKAASEIYAPVSGEIIDINKQLEENPNLVNTDPYAEGWLFKIKLDEPLETDEFLDKDTYITTLDE